MPPVPAMISAGWAGRCRTWRRATRESSARLYLSRDGVRSRVVGPSVASAVASPERCLWPIFSLRRPSRRRARHRRMKGSPCAHSSQSRGNNTACRAGNVPSRDTADERTRTRSREFGCSRWVAGASRACCTYTSRARFRCDPLNCRPPSRAADGARTLRRWCLEQRGRTLACT
jgi:hypothetical protein